MADQKYWLFKSEPNAYSFSNLLQESGQTAEWDGVRNYQARNFIRDDMKVGDSILFYHSSTGSPAVVGTARVVREAYPDDTAWDPKSIHFDPKSTPDNPIWYMVDVRAEKEFSRQVTLSEIKQTPKLQNMMLVRRGVRLSILPISKDEWEEIISLGNSG